MLDAETAVMVHNIYMRGIYNGILSIALAVWIGIGYFIVDRVILMIRVNSALKQHRKILDAVDQVQTQVNRAHAKTFGN